MKICLRFACFVVVACTLVSCQLASSALSIPGRVLQLLGRTAGVVGQADSPDASLEAVEQRGQLIEQRGPHSPTAPAMPTRSAVVQR